MARLQLRSLAAVSMPWFGLVLGGCDPSATDHQRSEDAGEDAGSHRDADAAEVDASEPPPPGAGTGAPFPPIMIPSNGSYCALSVGAQCDGREDCPEGQVCCARFNSRTFSYDNITCETSCPVPTHYEVCHVEKDGAPDCADPNMVCRPSLIAQFDFISVCVLPVGTEAESTGRGYPGRIACGDDTSCEVGEEQCCLRASFDFATAKVSFLEPFCAPLEAGSEACGCDAEPPSTSDPRDAGIDASPGDASPGDASEPQPSDEDAG